MAQKYCPALDSRGRVTHENRRQSCWLFGAYRLVSEKGKNRPTSPKTFRHPVVRSFCRHRAVADAAEISAWAVVAPSHYTPRQAEAAVETMAEAFELNRLEYNVQLRSTGHYGYALLDYELSDTVHLRIQVQSLDTETIACIEIRQTVHRGLETMHRQTLQAFAALGIAAEEVKITSCLEGHVNARLRDSDKLNLVYSAFNAVDAAYQEGVNANGVAVWSGWSPRFAQSVHTGIGEATLAWLTPAKRQQPDGGAHCHAGIAGKFLKQDWPCPMRK